ncbi:Predicted arabinose efflux permease, MFS family [Faunimonas pinastri]|uniref:Predicted arabinose efflux permease, MFS family n=1 Tax=Faunimonas pinastri TaxID=1855383 RepID=A0A1H9CEB3_9HYPH|nr:MFS transporter [Faunimonas pinastri]SEP99484.1 Predicted arabinose efflux permease, MFS family [Faunimonas pinastri]
MPDHAGLSRSLVTVMAVACGAIVANIYYAQPLVGLIAPSIRLDQNVASFVVTLTQLGYCVGLILLVPLGDLLENRKAIVVTLLAAVVALLAAMFAPSAGIFLAAALAIGITSVAVQMLVPLAAHMAPEETRGRVVGNVMGGLIAGILLARPVASLIADSFGWRAVFGFSAVVTILFTILLAAKLPRRQPAHELSYAGALRSLWGIFRDTPILRRRAAYQAAVFASFALFWTAAPLELAGPNFNMTQRGIALFALAGAAGAFAAPIGGRIADRGWSKPATALALLLVAASFLLARLGSSGSLAAMVIAGILLDSGVQANQVMGQREIYSLHPHLRSRLNAVYMAIVFLGGSLGSAVASVSYTHGGWGTVCWVGIAFPLAALAFYMTELFD